MWPVWSMGRGLLTLVVKDFSMLFRIRSMHVQLGGELRSSETTFWGHFSKIVFCNLISTVQLPRLPLWSSHQKAGALFTLLCCTLSLTHPESIASKTEKERKKSKGCFPHSLGTTDHPAGEWVSLRVLGTCYHHHWSLPGEHFPSSPAWTRGLLELSLSTQICTSWFGAVLWLGWGMQKGEGSGKLNSSSLVLWFLVFPSLPAFIYFS